MTNSVKLDTSKLDELIRETKKNYIVKIGVLTGKDARPGDNSNATIGMTHEYGSMSRGIPARSFLRVPLNEELSGRAAQIGNLIGRAIEERNVKKAFVGLAAIGLDVIDGAFKSNGYGKWPALTEKYSKAKSAKGGSERILIDSGQLRRSITYKVVSK